MLKKDCSLSFGHGPSTEKRRAVAPDRESGQPRQIGSFTLKYEGNRQPPHGSRVLIFEALGVRGQGGLIRRNTANLMGTFFRPCMPETVSAQTRPCIHDVFATFCPVQDTVMRLETQFLVQIRDQNREAVAGDERPQRPPNKRSRMGNDTAALPDVDEDDPFLRFFDDPALAELDKQLVEDGLPPFVDMQV